jgi:S-DNA-T family DNA segregation ATPase FtsK/SpoIIIE
MTSMTNKVLKTELFLLFLLTLLALTAFYLGDTMPDNFLSISSGTNDSGSLSYVFSSVVVAVGYYLGPWVIAPFLIFALFYTLQFSRRNIPLDSINFISLSLGSLFLIFFFAPHFLGNGIHFLLKGNFSYWESLSLGLIFTFGFVAGSFRSSFKKAMVKFFVFLGELPSLVWHFLTRFRPIETFKRIRHGLSKRVERVKVLVPSMLSGKKIMAEASPVKNISAPKFTKKAKYFENEDLENLNAAELEDKEHEARFTLNTEDQGNMAPLVEERTHLSSHLDSQKIMSEQSLAMRNYQIKGEVAKEQKYYDIVTTMTHQRSKRDQNHPDSDYFQKIIDSIQDTLAEFKIDARIVNILKGPVVDTFEVELGPGVKVAKVTNAESEISMALLGAPIRIVYPMIGRATVGIEVPRNPREIIYLDEVLSTPEFKSSNTKLPIAMGKDAFGEPLIVDLASMPHMLVAGATGAGKSVFINTLLVSLLVKKSPSQMKLILIDPKQLELALYANLPHLVMPVVTDAKTASISLLWACQEMERRYSILKELGVRNIEGFNEKLKKATPEMLAKIHSFYENEPEEHYELPYLTIIVDEFADLILTKAGKDIENNICRLAAKARAAGIHLVLATQRPSVDVITGLIKSNFPTRVSFRVTSSQDSRTILNSMGAEKLLGKGDMLYRHGTNNLRVHSSYVDEDEIEALTDKLAGMPNNYHTGAMSFLENGGDEERDEYSFGSHIAGGASSAEPSSDEDYFRLAVKTVIEHRTASASMLQRKLRVGYNRAANLIEEMEAKGIVGPAEGSKRRKVLWTTEDL